MNKQKSDVYQWEMIDSCFTTVENSGVNTMSVRKGLLILFVLLIIHGVSFSEALDDYLFLYSDGTQSGYMCADGSVAIIPQWEIAYPFEDGKSIVGTKDESGEILYGIIDKSGEYIVDPMFTQIEKDQFVYGSTTFYFLSNDSSVGLYDVERNEIVLLNGFREINVLQSGQYIAVRDHNSFLWGYVDYSGTIVIPCKYDEAYGFVNGYGFVSTYDGFNDMIEHALIDMIGEKVILPEQVEAYGNVHNNRFIIRSLGTQTKYGICDISGGVVLEPQYDWISEFDNGIAVFSDNMKNGCISEEGTILVPAIFDYVSIEEGGVIVEFMSNMYIIDPLNMQITPH